MKSYSSLLALILLLFFVSGRLFFFWRQPAPAVSWEQGKTFCFIRPPEKSFGRQWVRLGTVKVYFSLGTHFRQGDCLFVKGRLEKTKFGLVVKEAQAKVLSPPSLWLKAKTKVAIDLLFFQQRLAGVYQRFLPEPESSLLSGIVLGAKSQLPADFYQALQKTGTLHIVVASGYNLTVISQRPVEILSWWFGRRLSLIIGGGLVWFYVILTGGQPPIVRAAIIISFIYWGQFLGRRFDVWRAFFVALGLMLFVNPALIANISFQLSLTAMAGILLLAPRFERLARLPLVGRELAETLGAQLMVTPVIAYHFAAFSWASPLVNALVLPLVPFLMQWGLAGLAGVVWLPLAQPFLLVCYPLLAVFVRLVNFWGQFDFIQLRLNFNFWLVVGYYLVLGWWLARKRG